MSNQIDDGGQGIMDAKGMPLRDWFAGMAMQGLCAGFSTNDRGFPDDRLEHYDVTALHAYGMADAMLAARKESK